MLEKLGSKFIRSLGRFLACNQKRSSIYIYILIYFYIAVFRDTDFIGPHFVRHSIRETFSSSTFAVLFPFFSHLPRRAFLSLLPPPPFPLDSHASSTSSRYLLLVSRPRRSRCHPPRPLERREETSLEPRWNC